MNVLQLHIDDIVWFDAKYIRIKQIYHTEYSVDIAYDILEDDLFLTKKGCAYLNIKNSELHLDLFE